MKLRVLDDGSTTSLAVTDVGPVSISIPHSIIKRAAQVAMMYRLSGDTEASVGGFFDEIGKGLTFIKHQILDNPITRSVVNAIPFGGTVLAATDMVEAGVNLGQKALAGVPPTTRAVTAKAAQGDPRARAKIAKMRADAKAGNPAAKKAAAGVALASKLMLAQRALLDAKRKIDRLERSKRRKISAIAMPPAVDQYDAEYELPEEEDE